jgi:hypothetical protein
MAITVPNLKATRLSRQMLILARIEQSARVLIGIICNSRYGKGPTRDTGLKGSGMSVAEWKLPLPLSKSSVLNSSFGAGPEMKRRSLEFLAFNHSNLFLRAFRSHDAPFTIPGRAV